MKNYKEILKTIPHNTHQLNRYIKFVDHILKNPPKDDYTEKHHICPKSKNYFPQYKSFTENPWNLVVMSPRQHFIAHRMLWKSYGGLMARAFWMMSYTGSGKLDSRSHVEIRNVVSKLSSKQGLSVLTFEQRSEIAKTRIKNDPEKHARVCGMGGTKSQELYGSQFSKYTKEQRNEYAKRAAASNKEQGINFFSVDFQSEMGKRGGVKHAGSRCYNNGTTNFKFMTTETISFDEFLSKNPQFVAGKLVERIKCVHCGLESSKTMITRWHNDNCRTKSDSDK